MDRVVNAWIREVCRVMPNVDEKILGWFGYSERMKNDRIAKRVYVGNCVGNCLVGQLKKRWIDSVKDFLKKRGLNVGQARRKVHDRNE